MQEAKWLSEEALQIAEKRRQVKGKGECLVHHLLHRYHSKIQRMKEWKNEIHVSTRAKIQNSIHEAFT